MYTLFSSHFCVYFYDNAITNYCIYYYYMCRFRRAGNKSSLFWTAYAKVVPVRGGVEEAVVRPGKIT